MAAESIPRPFEVPVLKPAANPFLGLRRFEMDDSHLFFGRDDQTYDLLRRLRLLHFIAVLGPSGCGKSSLIRAGVLAALRDGYLADHKPWKIATLQPGNGPLEAWTSELKKYLRPGVDDSRLLVNPLSALDTSDGRIVILVDQCEELFEFAHRTGRGRDVQTFLEAMLATRAPESEIYVVLTMRSEYLAQCALYPKLSQAINEGLYLVPRMTREQMREAIVSPIQMSGSAITAPLVDRLLNDASSETDGLPVLQHALMRMWSKKKAWEPLGLGEYEATRGLGAFLNDHADDVYRRLSEEQHRIAEALFRAITERTEDGRAVRRALDVEQIFNRTFYAVARLLPVIEAFRDEGFLIVTQSTRSVYPLVDISHEAVARQWARLSGWITAEALHRRAMKRLADDAKEWDSKRRKSDFLLRGLQFDSVICEVHEPDMNGLSSVERDFLIACAKAKRLTWLLSWKVFGPAFVLLGVLCTLAVASLIYARDARRALAQERLARKQAMEQTNIANAETNRASAAVVAARVAQTEAAAAARKIITPQTTPKPRVYIQITSEEQRPQAKAIAEQLKAAGFLVPGIELLKSGPGRTELRYFKQADEADARQIAIVLADAGVAPTLVLVPGFEQSRFMLPKHYELWFASTRTAASAY